MARSSHKHTPQWSVLNMSSVIIFTAQARKMLDSAMQPGAAQKALSMQVESFWQRHGNKVLGLGAVVLSVCLVVRCSFPHFLASSALAVHGEKRGLITQALRANFI